MTKVFFLAVLCLLAVTSYSQTYPVDLPKVCPSTQNYINYYLKYLKLLLPTYNWVFCNKMMLYRVTALMS